MEIPKPTKTTACSALLLFTIMVIASATFETEDVVEQYHESSDAVVAEEMFSQILPEDVSAEAPKVPIARLKTTTFNSPFDSAPHDDLTPNLVQEQEGPGGGENDDEEEDGGTTMVGGEDRKLVQKAAEAVRQYVNYKMSECLDPSDQSNLVNKDPSVLFVKMKADAVLLEEVAGTMVYANLTGACHPYCSSTLYHMLMHMLPPLSFTHPPRGIILMASHCRHSRKSRGRTFFCPTAASSPKSSRQRCINGSSRSGRRRSPQEVDDP